MKQHSLTFLFVFLLHGNEFQKEQEEEEDVKTLDGGEEPAEPNKQCDSAQTINKIVTCVGVYDYVGWMLEG